MAPTPVEVQLKEMKEEGLPVYSGKRTAVRPNVEGKNRKILEAWFPRWALHAAQNYQQIRNGWGVNFLQASAVGLPAVCVGIGPSFDKDVKDLKTYQTNVLIIASDAALRPLVANGIHPHLVVTFDCKAEQASLFEGVNTSRYTLVANSCTHPNTIRAWKGKFIFFNMVHRGIEFMDVVLPSVYPDFGGISSLGTVGNSCVLLAYQLGCKPIMTTGMDLCFQEGKYRCKDYRYENWREHSNAWHETESKLLYNNKDRTDYAYETVLKDKKFLVDENLETYRTILLNLIGQLGVKFIDCSQGGILGACGVETSTLKDAILTHAKQPISRGQSALFHLDKVIPSLNPQHTGGQQCS